MTKYIDIDGKRVKTLVFKSGLSREKIVVLVQDSGFQFSLAGLEKIFRNELPKKETNVILEIIAESCGCCVSDFTEKKTQSA